VKRLKFIAPARVSKLETKPADTVYVGLEHVESWTGRLLLDKQPESVDSVVSSFKAGDVLFGKLRPYLAKAARADRDGVCTSEIIALRPMAECSQSYLTYFLLNVAYIKWLDSLTYGTKMPRVSPEQIGASFVSVPSKSEQRAIAAFLDRETARIDALVAKKERLIELLQEKRTALITRAVTKGLDPNVPMKDSGVEWLGEIPAHWGVKGLKSLSQLQTGLTLGKKYEGRNLVTRPYLRVANVQDGYLELDDVAEVELPEQDAPRYELRKGDVLMTEGGDFDKLGRGYVWEGQVGRCLHQNHIFAVRPRRELLSSRYLALALSSGYGRAYFTATSKQSTNLASTNSTKLRDLPMPVPSVPEQRAIVVFIEGETARIDALIAKVRDAIDRLKEFRTALISAAVTGKIDVREDLA
jgi:type I restriction enzyme S subunit